MKHLRHINESLKDDIYHDIMDICQELVDEGFEIFTNTYTDSFRTYISKSHTFSYDEILSETIERLKDFMKSKGYESKIIVPHGFPDCLPSSNLFDYAPFHIGMTSDHKMSHMVIDFSK